MKIGVLQAGPVPEEMAPRWGEYDRVFREFLHLAEPETEVTGWRAMDCEFPASPDEADAWIISGSKHGVYEPHEFIAPLKAFIREIVAAGRPLIGVCFGHQIMAEALGGRAEKSAKGWGLGRHEYDLAARPGWMASAPERLNITAVHQDQVTKRPADASAVMTSSFCENAALVYGDPDRPYAISIQPHPEFGPEFSRELIELRRGSSFPVDRADAGLASLDAGALDGEWAARWVFDFLGVFKKQAP